MRKILLVAFAALCALLSPLFAVGSFPQTAYAEGFVRVIEEGVTLYKSPVEHFDYALFFLPPTYYLRVVDESGAFYLVEYQDGENGFPALYGYVKKDAVSTEYQSPTYPLYDKQTLTVIKSCYVYAAPTENGDLLATALSGQTVRLYGAFLGRTGERLFYYVRFGNTMGYLPAECCSAPSTQPHPDPVLTPSVLPTDIPTAPPSGTAVAPVKKTEALQIALIFGVCVAVLLALYTVFRQKKPQERYFDEDE